MASSRGIFPTQGLNLHFLHCRQILYLLSHPFHASKMGLGIIHLFPPEDLMCLCRHTQTLILNLQLQIQKGELGVETQHLRLYCG